LKVAIPAMAMPAMARRFYLQIQPDWNDERAEEEGGSCWLDVYERSVVGRAREVHASASTQYQLPLHSDPAAASVVAPTAGEGERLGASEPHLVEVTRREKHWVEVSAAVPAGEAQLRQVRTVFQAPTDAFDLSRSLTQPVHSDAALGASRQQRGKPALQLLAVDVAGDEQHAAIGAADGTCLLWDASARAQMLPLAGHVADVTAVRFFPSSQVLLTGSLDFTLRIWSMTGRCAATLRGHVGGVEDVAIIGRGRNVACKALWCCGDGWTVTDKVAIDVVALLQRVEVTG
jgi:WD40 repeat protein